jgi:hypothetical protein
MPGLDESEKAAVFAVLPHFGRGPPWVGCGDSSTTSAPALLPGSVPTDFTRELIPRENRQKRHAALCAGYAERVFETRKQGGPLSGLPRTTRDARPPEQSTWRGQGTTSDAQHRGWLLLNRVGLALLPQAELLRCAD